MPPPEGQADEKSLEEVVADVGVYPIEAYRFIRQGLAYTVEKIHGEDPAGEVHHVSGQQLCEGLRDYALRKWGLLARTVLERWRITSTADFGRIVFALVDHGFMRRTDEDTLDDFRNVYDFKNAFESTYRIESTTP